MRTLLLSFLLIAICAITSCTKLDYTNLGSDLLPEVDNVNTFDTTLDVIANTYFPADDTIKLTSSDQMVIGALNDPIFGSSTARLFLELKPVNFPATAVSKSIADSFVTYDSTVLSIRVTGFFGDSTTPVTYSVYELADTLGRDTLYPLSATFALSGVPVGSKTVSVNSLMKDSVPYNKSSTVQYKTTRQLRIRLNNNDKWKAMLLDSAAQRGDSLFRTKYKGFAIVTTTGTPGTFTYVSIVDTATRLEFHYKRNPNGIDTTRTAFYFNANNSGFANNVQWEHGRGNPGSGSEEIISHLNPRPQGDSLLYLKTTPGTFVRIRIPGLGSVSNRIIHRAELKVVQVPSPGGFDNILSVPQVLYPERFDSVANSNKLMVIPFDLSPNEPYGNCFPTSNGIDYSYFGNFAKLETINNQPAYVYNINLSRYVQQIVTNRLYNSDLKLSANMFTRYPDCVLFGNAPIRVTSNIIGYGRIRIGGGSSSASPYKMRLRIIYSRL